MQILGEVCFAVQKYYGKCARSSGVDLTIADPRERNIAMVFQNYALYSYLTVTRTSPSACVTERPADLIQPTGTLTFTTIKVGGVDAVAELQAHDVSSHG
ncbi:hypothetical protein ACRQ5Q_11590 [Bradyrhizobium sp. PMVTL-01]|uniref:hypothetical protein n=1 Tax=Bradyrhizobium sp. PMVTL-01 TaxID=3434999 RepID=UPI003F6E6982